MDKNDILIPSLSDYIGRFNGGVMAAVGIMYKGIYYDSVLFYTDKEVIITVDDDLLNVLGCHVEELPYFNEFMEYVMGTVDPYESVYDKLEDIDPNLSS